MVTRGYENYSCGMRRMLRAFYNKNWCSRVFILEDDATRRDKRVRCLAGMVLWKAVSPLARHLQPALRDRHLATSRSFAAGGGGVGDSVNWRGDQYSWRYRRPWLTTLSQDEYFKNLSSSSSSSSRLRAVTLWANRGAIEVRTSLTYRYMYRYFFLCRSIVMYSLARVLTCRFVGDLCFSLGGKTGRLLPFVEERRGRESSTEVAKTIGDRV